MVLLALGSAPALACSIDAKHRVPTNVELVDKADLVVLAVVQSGPRTYEEGWNGRDFEPQVVLSPIKVIKGASPRRLHVEGVVSDERGRPYRRLPTALDDVHPSTLEGSCFRQRYPIGGMVLAMFRRTSSGYEQLFEPFARVVEDVEGPEALWPRAAELYVRLLRTREPAARRTAFLREQRRLAADGGSNTAIAKDIGRYLHATRK